MLYIIIIYVIGQLLVGLLVPWKYLDKNKEEDDFWIACIVLWPILLPLLIIITLFKYINNKWSDFIIKFIRK